MVEGGGRGHIERRECVTTSIRGVLPKNRTDRNQQELRPHVILGKVVG